MERDDRPPVGTFFADGSLATGATVTLGEQASHHARVKRLDVGAPIQLTNGAGSIGRGSIGALKKGAVDVVLDDVHDVPCPPAIHLRVPVADRDRMLWLAEKATELGLTTWQAVRFRRSASVSPRGEGSAFAEKVRARMVSALEQSGGAWLPSILPDTALAELSVAAGTLPIVLDPLGPPIARVVADAGPSAAPTIILGPEGGIEHDELTTLTNAGWRPASLAPTTLRFETAGIAAVAVIRAIRQHEET